MRQLRYVALSVALCREGVEALHRAGFFSCRPPCGPRGGTPAAIENGERRGAPRGGVPRGVFREGCSARGVPRGVFHEGCSVWGCRGGAEGAVLPLVFGTTGVRDGKSGGLCVSKAKRIRTILR
eukprot:610933-Prorocentrum_minimum.AAC.2